MGVENQERRSGSVVDHFEVWVHVMEPKTRLHLDPLAEEKMQSHLFIADRR